MVRGRQTGCLASSTVDIGDNPARPADDVMVVVADPGLAQTGQVGSLHQALRRSGHAASCTACRDTSGSASAQHRKSFPCRRVDAHSLLPGRRRGQFTRRSAVRSCSRRSRGYRGHTRHMTPFSGISQDFGPSCDRRLLGPDRPGPLDRGMAGGSAFIVCSDERACMVAACAITALHLASPASGARQEGGGGKPVVVCPGARRRGRAGVCGLTAGVRQADSATGVSPSGGAASTRAIPSRSMDVRFAKVRRIIDNRVRRQTA